MPISGRIYLFIFVTIILLTSCKTDNCNSLPDHFSSNVDGLSKIKSSDFRIRDSIDNYRGHWLKSANYYTCDGKVGFFVYQLISGAENFNQGVPIRIWKEFRNSESKESYFEENIFNKYPKKILQIIETQ